MHEPSNELARADQLFETDPTKALEVLTKLADEGSSWAMYNIGAAYALGELGAVNTKLAEAWLRRATLGDASHAAHCALGVLYKRNGLYGRAVEEYETAAAQGYPPAMRALARVYFEAEGVPRDLEKAEFWWERAVARGNFFSMKRYGLAILSGEFGLRRLPRGALLLFQAYILGTYFALRRGTAQDSRFQ